jgi:hypothetical protein
MKRLRAPTEDAVRWSVYRLRKKAEGIGFVQAKGPATAIERSFEVLAIPENERWRIRVSSARD